MRSRAALRPLPLQGGGPSQKITNEVLLIPPLCFNRSSHFRTENRYPLFLKMLPQTDLSFSGDGEASPSATRTSAGDCADPSEV